MIQCELEDGRFMFINLDRVISIMNRPDKKMILTYIGPEEQARGNVLKRFQVIKTGTWFRTEQE